MSDPRKRKYDSTVARIAGNIASGLVNHPRYQAFDSHTLKNLGVKEAMLARDSVSLALHIVAEAELREAHDDPA